MLSKGRIRHLNALRRRKDRAERGEFLVEGVRLVEDLLDSPVVPRLAVISPSLEDTPRGAELARRVRRAVETLDATDAELSAIADTDTPQGVVVAAAIPQAGPEAIAPRPGAPVIVLDGIQDPGNFGTIVRSADAFGAASVVTLPNTVDPWNPKAVRSAAGSSLRVPIVECSLDTLLARLHDAGAVLLGADMQGVSVEEIDRTRPIALVLGNEGAGLGVAVRAACDALVAVPIRGAAESLNVGVAAGILMYLLSREA